MNKLIAVVLIIYIVVNELRLNWIRERLEQLESEVYMNKSSKKEPEKV